MSVRSMMLCTNRASAISPATILTRSSRPWGRCSGSTMSKSTISSISSLLPLAFVSFDRAHNCLASNVPTNPVPPVMTTFMTCGCSDLAMNRSHAGNRRPWQLQLRQIGLGGASPADEAPDEQHNDRTDHGADESCAFSRRVPAERLAQIARDDRADDSKNGGENETARFILAGHDEFGDDAGEEPDDDRPDDTHCALSQLSGWRSTNKEARSSVAGCAAVVMERINSPPGLMLRLSLEEMTCHE